MVTGCGLLIQALQEHRMARWEAFPAQEPESAQQPLPALPGQVLPVQFLLGFTAGVV